MDNFPTVESIKEEYPNSITADSNEGLIRKWLENLPVDKKHVIPWDNYFHSHINTYVGEDVIETDELYPQCNYCIGGALQMAFGETEQDDVDDSRQGIFPATQDLANTLHYFCEIPYKTVLPSSLRCPFPQHKGRDCVIALSEADDDSVYALADKITRANDRGDFDEAWSYVEFVLKLGRKNLEENK